MIEVKLYDIGEGIHEGEILTYFVKEGDKIAVDQPLVEVQTEKLVAELPSPAAGVVKEILVEEGTTITVGTTVLTIQAEKEASVENQTEQPETHSVKKENSTTRKVSTLMEKPIENKSAVIATPYTRKIARDNNIDISLVKGSGIMGRVLEEDIYEYIKQQEVKEVAATKINYVDTEPMLERIDVNENSDTIPFRGIRKQIAKKMTKSLFTIPHVTHFEEIDMTNLLDYRNKLKALDVNISVVAFFIKALAVALEDFPIFNAKLDEENEVIRLEKVVHMGIATDSEQGLIVPVLKNVKQKSLQQIQVEMKELSSKAKEGKLSVNEMTGSTFTISNVGPFGSIGATPIINYPETGLIAFHKTKKMPVVNENEEIVIRSIMNISMSFDHRVADGGTAVAFTNRFKKLIEVPDLLFLELS